MILKPGGSGGSSLRVARSLRLNTGDSARLSNTSVTPTNDKIFTYSCWVKRAKLGAVNTLIAADTATMDIIQFDAAGTLSFILNGTTYYRTSTKKFVDVSGWYHIVAKFDSPQVVAADRLRIYVNGVELTSWSVNVDIPSNQVAKLNTVSKTRYVGAQNASLTFPGYMAEIHFVDGQALIPAFFGRNNPITSCWEPIPYSSAHGLNGFYLDFSDNSNTTSTTLGKDRAGSNNFTPIGFSVAAGITNDSFTDTPTNYLDAGVLHGNFPIFADLEQGTGGTIDDGGLFWGSGADTQCYATMGVSTGKWYWEIHPQTGFALAAIAVTPKDGTYAGSGANGWGLFGVTGIRYHSGSIGSIVNGSFGSGDIIMMALDRDNGKLFIGKNGTWMGSPAGDPVAGTDPAFSSITGFTYPCASSSGSAGSAGSHFNFGQRPFTYSIPTGYKALCTENLPEETVLLSGSFPGNASTDGPVVPMLGVPATLSIDGNAVTFGTHADAETQGFKLKTAASPYNQAGTRNWTATGTVKRKNARGVF